MRTEISIDCNGYAVKADWYEGENAEKILYILIGHNSNKKRYIDLATRMVELTGMSALVLDYSGHGESPFLLGELTPAQNFLEVVTVFDWIQDKYPESSISVIGGSYGGFLATYLTVYRTFTKLLLRVPAMYKPEEFYTKWSLVDSDERKDYRSDASNFTEHPLLNLEKKFKGDVFVVTHELDDVCLKSTTDAFIKIFDAETWEGKGFKHGFGESDVTEEQVEEYVKVMCGWLKKD